MNAGPILYPNVTALPAKPDVGQPDRQNRKQDGAPGEFDRVFDERVAGIARHDETLKPAKPEAHPAAGPASDLSRVKAPLKFSAHASQRLQERRIQLDPATLTKVNDAIDKAQAKGIDDTLVLTKDAALIVNVPNRTVITAMDKNSLVGNVFTNIDGAVVV